MRSFKSSGTMNRFCVSCLLVLLMFFTISIPAEFCRAISSPTFWTSRYFMTGLTDEGSVYAGVKGFANEYVYYPTSRWTQMIFDLQNGGFVCQANLIQIPGTLLPLTFTLSYSSFNASLDIGMGKGWTSNLHSCLSEDSQTHDITLVTANGAKLLFDWDSTNSVYLNPKSFCGVLVKNQDDTYTLHSLSGEISTYNSAGKLTQLTARTGGQLDIGYDGSGRPITLTDDLSSRAITLTWSTGGKLASVEDVVGNTWSFTYSQDGNHLDEIQQPSNENPNPDIHTTFAYDQYHKMISQTDFEGYEYTLTYHTTGYQTGKIATHVQPTENSATTSFTYEEDEDGYDKKTTVTDGAAHETYYWFNDASGHVEKISMGTGGSEIKTIYTYNQLGLISSLIDSYNYAKAITYDTVGHITEITYPSVTAGQFVQQFSYSSATIDGKVMQAQDKIGTNSWATTIFEYTDQNAPYNPSSITDPLGHETTIEYNSDKQPVEITSDSTNGTKTTSMFYNPYTGDLTITSDFEGNDTTYSYNNNGFVASYQVYDGTTGIKMLSNQTITYNALNLQTDTSDDTTDETTSQSFGANGESTGSTLESGCSTGVSYSYTIDSTSYLHPNSINGTKPSSGISGESGCFLSYNPNPHSSTDSMGHTSTYSYYLDGGIHESTDYLDQTTDYTQDSFGRIDTITDPVGRELTYTYDLNSRVTEEEIEGIGTYAYIYDALGAITQITDPIKGAMTYAYSINGNLVGNPYGTYSYNSLGQKTYASYVGSSSDSWSYNPDGFLSEKNSFSWNYDKLGNKTIWNDGASNSCSISYGGPDTPGSKVLGLPYTISGSGGIGSYSFDYNQQHRMASVTETNKSLTFDYSWNTDGTLSEIVNPNDTVLSQTYANKILDQITVSIDQTEELSVDSTYSSDQRTGYDYTVHASPNDFTESNTITYDSTTHRLESLEYSSNSRTIDFAYDNSVGNLTTMEYSDLGTYSFTYDSQNRIDDITYPNSQGTASYTYETSGRGRLTSISYPNNKTISFTWDDRDRITNVSLNNNGTTTSYYLSYNDLNQIKQIVKSEGGFTINSWNFVYGPFGLERGILKDSNNQVLLTQKYSPDFTGRILSMTNTPGTGQEGFSGEVFYHYDTFGNTALLTDSSGDPVLSYLYDINSSNIINEWNPNNIINLFKQGGIRECFSFSKPWNDGAIVISNTGSPADVASYYTINVLNTFPTIGIVAPSISLTSSCTGGCSGGGGAKLCGALESMPCMADCMKDPNCIGCCFDGVIPCVNKGDFPVILVIDHGHNSNNTNDPKTLSTRKTTKGCWIDLKNCLWNVSGAPAIITLFLLILARIGIQDPSMTSGTISDGLGLLAGGTTASILSAAALALKSTLAKFLGWVTAFYYAWQVGTCINHLILCYDKVKKQEG